MSEPPPEKKPVRVIKKGARLTPAKADVREEIKRISDLLLTLSRRVGQLKDSLTTE